MSVSFRSKSGCLAGLLLSSSLLGCQGDIGDGETNAPPVDVAFEKQQAVLPRLTEPQLSQALVALFGAEVPIYAQEPDTNPFLFTSIGATSTTLSELGVEQLETMAEGVSVFVFEDPARRTALVGCEPVTPGDGCVAQFLESFGRRAFRRPLADNELQRWLGVSQTLADGDAWHGLRLAVSGMLQSPSFVYRVELGESDPDKIGTLRLTDYELASKLSFVLWNAPPDDALLDAAARGDLRDAQLLEDEVRRLLDDPRAKTATRSFFAEYLDLNRLSGITRDALLYPTFSPALADAMRAEIELVVNDLVYRQDADIRTLFSTTHTFVNASLAELYGIEAPGATEITFVPVDLPADSPRAGILALAGVLTMNAHEASTSPTLRGKFLRERVLCDEVPAPPPDVSTVIEQNPADPKTLRETLEQHRANPACAGCHSFIDPPGYLFENFDAIGAYRTTDNGYPVDASGSLNGVTLSGAKDLAALLANDERVGRCIVKQLYRHTHGRLDQKGEEPALLEIEKRFAASGYRFRELMVLMLTHESFRLLAPSEVSP